MTNRKEGYLAFFKSLKWYSYAWFALWAAIVAGIASTQAFVLASIVDAAFTAFTLFVFWCFTMRCETCDRRFWLIGDSIMHCCPACLIIGRNGPQKDRFKPVAERVPAAPIDRESLHRRAAILPVPRGFQAKPPPMQPRLPSIGPTDITIPVLRKSLPAAR